MYGSERSFTWCASFFYFCNHKITDKSKLRKEGFVWAHGLRAYSPSRWKRHGGRDVRQLAITLCLSQAAERKEGRYTANVLISSLFIILEPQLMGCLLPSGLIFLPRLNFSRNVPTEKPRNVLQGVRRLSQVDREDSPSHTAITVDCETLANGAGFDKV